MDAIAEYQKAIEIAPSAPSLNEGLGDAYRMSTQLEKAEKAYSRELELDPQNLMAMYYLGEIRVVRGNGAAALPILQAVLKEKPKFTDARYYLARGLAEVGQNAAAEEQFKLVIQDAPESELAQRTYYQLGRLYRVMKRPQDVERSMQEFERLKAAAYARESANLEQRKKAHAERDADQNP
jgi:tetratricopeptide (TPR) repeat protein